ncbi:dihydrodipicolinate synthase family protein [Streptomyces scabiei]|uniref:N-acetylneuraminate lyase n=1 Tax=Streptomyces scabiei TaxID=1930 RepID=A0A100JW41_STRSC|nr:dihydrodipicolinate synthase family protein [Streptomyces scabiei]GAQ66752.1 N-acetylneuraminate lyase [Streptomyces scabiei]
MTELAGVFSAVATPFRPEDASLDVGGLRDLVERTITGGIHGLVPNGSTGEFPSLSGDERREVAEVVIDQAAGRVPVIPHVAAMTTKEAVSLAQHAEAAGAAAVMAVAPYYEPLTIEEIKKYFLTIAGSVSVPVVVYNLPVATGVNLTAEHVVDLARRAGNITHVKDTTGDLSQAARLIHDHGDEIKTLVGWDTLFFASLLEGAAGSIVGAANFIAPELVAIYDAVRAGQISSAKKDWDRIFPIMQFLVGGGYVPAVRAALDITGHSAGPAREPIGPLESERYAELEALLKPHSA